MVWSTWKNLNNFNKRIESCFIHREREDNRDEMETFFAHFWVRTFSERIIFLQDRSALSQCDEKLGTMECQENNNSSIPKNFLYLARIVPAKLWRLPHYKWLASWVRSSANYQLCKKFPITSYIKKYPNLVLCGRENCIKRRKYLPSSLIFGCRMQIGS